MRRYAGWLQGFYPEGSWWTEYFVVRLAHYYLLHEFQVEGIRMDGAQYLIEDSYLIEEPLPESGWEGRE